jgi:hypothetical protein
LPSTSIDLMRLGGLGTGGPPGRHLKGFTITGARGEGIAVFPAGARNHGTPPFIPVGNVQLLNNTVNNGQHGVGGVALFRLHRARPVPGDCGAGILLEAVANSLISGNTVEHNIEASRSSTTSARHMTTSSPGTLSRSTSTSAA